MLKTFYSRQARNPSGLFGRLFMSLIFDKGNSALNARLIELAAVQQDTRMLEIGFGPGGSIHQMAKVIQTGLIEGIDTSEAMLKAAAKKNRRHIAAGKVKLTLGDFDTADYPEHSFDTVCTANTIYFWPDPRTTLAKIQHILKPGGRFILGFMEKSAMDALPLDMEVFTSFSLSDVQELLDEAGFSTVTAHALPGKRKGLYCVVAKK